MCSREVKALKYFKLLSMRYSDKTAVDQRLNPGVKELIFSNLTVLQPCNFVEHLCKLQNRY